MNKKQITCRKKKYNPKCFDEKFQNENQPIEQ